MVWHSKYCSSFLRTCFCFPSGWSHMSVTYIDTSMTIACRWRLQKLSLHPCPTLSCIVWHRICLLTHKSASLLWQPFKWSVWDWYSQYTFNIILGWEYFSNQGKQIHTTDLTSIGLFICTENVDHFQYAMLSLYHPHTLAISYEAIRP